MTESERLERDRQTIIQALEQAGVKVLDEGGAAELLGLKPTAGITHEALGNSEAKAKHIAVVRPTVASSAGAYSCIECSRAGRRWMPKQERQ